MIAPFADVFIQYPMGCGFCLTLLFWLSLEIMLPFVFAFELMLLIGYDAHPDENAVAPLMCIINYCNV